MIGTNLLLSPEINGKIKKWPTVQDSTLSYLNIMWGPANDTILRSTSHMLKSENPSIPVTVWYFPNAGQAKPVA